MTQALIILNDALYGTKRSYNGLRLFGSLAKRDGVEVRVFLTGGGFPDGLSSKTKRQGRARTRERQNSGDTDEQRCT